jgi:hypothetical protein
VKRNGEFELYVMKADGRNQRDGDIEIYAMDLIAGTEVEGNTPEWNCRDYMEFDASY